MRKSPEPAPKTAAPIGPESTDTELVFACRAGNGTAWRLLVHRYEKLVLAVARRHRLGREEASDVFEAVFAELWDSLGRLEQPQSVRSWLATVARRHSLAQSLYQRRWVELAELDESREQDGELAGDALLLQLEREETMRVAMARLSPRCRRVIEWLFFTDPPPDYQEIGRRLGLTPNSIGFIRGRCLRKLKEYMAEDGQS
ncbi:MAG TPA: sigma-70 family RNA polymerase sigma factor [Terriglobales bacterium]